jgi:gamma-glutamyltranspeptidase
MTPQEAISAPRIDCSEPATAVDRRIPASVRAALEARGHRLNVPAGRVGASAGAIVRDARNGHLRGGEEPTGQGIAAGLSADAEASISGGSPEDRLLWTSDL